MATWRSEIDCTSTLMLPYKTSQQGQCDHATRSTALCLPRSLIKLIARVRHPHNCSKLIRDFRPYDFSSNFSSLSISIQVLPILPSQLHRLRDHEIGLLDSHVPRPVFPVQTYAPRFPHSHGRHLSTSYEVGISRAVCVSLSSTHSSPQSLTARTHDARVCA